MSVLTLDYFVFLIIVLLLYYLLPAKFQWVLLLVSSLFFYINKAAWYQSLAFFVFILINYLASLYLEPDNKNRKKAFTAIIVFDILVFILFKYPKFFYSTLISLLRMLGSEATLLPIQYFVSYAQETCPIHIAYFGLIVIGYICDVYWGKVTLQKNPGKFAVFASFFPQIVSGPIVTYKQMETELFVKEHKFSYDKVVRGAERIIWGAFKKLVVAERCSVIVNAIYGDYETYHGLYVPFAAVMFVAQLYADFSGLMDIVIGTAEMFDITLPENFNFPFLSRNLSEFWRRWHITLGEWLKDYVLFPIYRSKGFRKLDKWCKAKWGKKYAKKFDMPTYISLFVSWFIIGLWHGGGWNYIFGVGLYMWAIIVLSSIAKPLLTKLTEILHINTECFSYRLFQRARTFVIYAFGLSFFRADTIKSGFSMWKAAFYEFNPWIFVDRSLLELGLDRIEWEILAIGLIVINIVSILGQLKGSVRDTIGRQNFVFRLAVYLTIFMATVIWGYYGAGFNAENFIYGRF